MKLRIRGNSLRLRLTQTEVDAMGRGGSVEEVVTFGADSRMTYRLSQSSEIDTPVAAFDGELIDITLPRATVTRWAQSDETGIGAAQDLPDGESLGILIEKDFACLQPRDGEDETDMFAHPQPGDAKC